MKKRLIRMFAIIFTLFFVGNINVFAAENLLEIPANAIPSDTYIIGSHIFTEERLYLSTQDIMWAARTIEGNSKDDMIIYYKDINGEWVDGLTGEEITIPSTFKVEEVDSELAKMLMINSVYVEYDSEEDYYFDSLDPNDYSAVHFNINKQDINTNITELIYWIDFDAYAYEDGMYTLKNFVCYDSFDTESPTITLSDQELEIYSGYFDLELDINPAIFDEEYENYLCTFSLVDEYDDETSGFFMISVANAEPQLVSDAFGISAHDNEEGFEYLYHNNLDFNSYRLLDNDVYSNAIILDFYSRYISDGDYNIDVTVFKDDEEITIKDSTKILSINTSQYYNNYLTVEVVLEEDVEPGHYEINVCLKELEDFCETVYVDILPDSRVTPIDFEVTKSANSQYYEDYDSILFYDYLHLTITPKDGKNSTDFTVTYETDLEDGEYFIDLELDTVRYYLPENYNVRSSHYIEVKNGRFDIDFTLPPNNYYSIYRIFVNIYKEYEEESILVGTTFVEIENDDPGFTYIWGEEIDGAGQSYLYIVDKNGKKYEGTIFVKYKDSDITDSMYVPYDGLLLARDIIEITYVSGDLW